MSIRSNMEERKVCCIYSYFPSCWTPLINLLNISITTCSTCGVKGWTSIWKEVAKTQEQNFDSLNPESRRDSLETHWCFLKVLTKHFYNEKDPFLGLSHKQFITAQGTFKFALLEEWEYNFCMTILWVIEFGLYCWWFWYCLFFMLFFWAFIYLISQGVLFCFAFPSPCTEWCTGYLVQSSFWFYWNSASSDFMFY